MGIAGLINSENIIKEEWKYTKISNFSHFNFDSKNQSSININIEKNELPLEIQNRTFLISNFKKSKISIKDLNDLSKPDLSVINLFLKRVVNKLKNPFVDINKKYCKNGLFLKIKDNTNLINPIIIKTNSKKTLKNEMRSEKLFIYIGKNVSGTIFIDEEIVNKCNLNTLFEIIINKNSNVKIIHFSNKTNVTQILNFSCVVDNDSTFKYIPIDISGKLIKKNLHISLEKNSSCFIESLNILNKKNYIDNYINIYHDKENTLSSVNQKNILKDYSTGIFYAKATISKHCINSEANQNNNNLMLSDKAIIHSNPQLEIYNNDVKCSHGSTTGEMDHDALFYMRSRGISLNACKQIILNAFINQIVYKIDNACVQTLIDKKINSLMKYDY